MSNSENPDSISIGGDMVSVQDFSEALWCLLAEDHYGFQDEHALEASAKLAVSIRSHFDVEVVLVIFRASPTGDENDVIGLVRSKDRQTQMVYWTSDAGGIVGLMVMQVGEKFPSAITGLFQRTGANLCQISGTEIFNKRPDLLTKGDWAKIIEQLIANNDMGWDTLCDGVATTAEFLDKNYRE